MSFIRSMYTRASPARQALSLRNRVPAFSSVNVPRRSFMTSRPRYALYEELTKRNFVQEVESDEYFMKLPEHVKQEVRAMRDQAIKADDVKAVLAKFSEVKPAVRPDDPEDPMITQARENLKKGNLAEAYTLSPEAGALGKSGILEKFGMFPLVGAGLAIAISKEFWIMSEEVLVVGTFVSFVTAAVITQGEAVSQAIDRDIAQIRHEQEQWYDAAIDTVNTNVKMLEQQAAMMESLTQLFDLYDKVAEKYVQTRGRVFRKQFNEMALSKLEEIQTIEEDMLNQFVKRIAAQASSFVRKQYLSNEELRRAFNAASIEVLTNMSSGNKSVSDPSSKVLSQYSKKLGAAIKRAQQERTLSDEEYNHLMETAKREKQAMIAEIEGDKAAQEVLAQLTPENQASIRAEVNDALSKSDIVDIDIKLGKTSRLLY